MSKLIGYGDTGRKYNKNKIDNKLKKLSKEIKTLTKKIQTKQEYLDSIQDQPDDHKDVQDWMDILSGNNVPDANPHNKEFALLVRNAILNKEK